MAKSFDEILKMATVAQSSTKQEPQKRTFDEVLKLASTKRKATSADQKQWNNFNTSAQNYFNNYGTRSDYASARENSQKASADYWALAKQAEDLRFNLNMLDIDDAKKSDLLKNIEQILNGARDTKAFVENSVSFYSSFGSQEEYDNWQKTNDLIGKYNDYENIDDAIAEIDAEIKKREPQVYTTHEKRPAGSKISSGGYNSREAMKYHPDNNPTETLSEKNEKISELELLKSQKAKLEAKKRLDERNEALKEKYVLFKGDNQFDLVADTGAKLKNPTLNKAIEYGQVDFVKNPLTFFLDNIGYGNNSFLQQFADNGNNWAKIMQKGYEQNWEELEPDEIKMYNYLLAKRGKEDAEQFLDDLKPILTERGAEADRQKRAEEWKQLNGWEKVGKNVETVLKNPINNLTAGLETIASFVVGDDAPTIEREKLSASQQVRELTAEDLTKGIDSNLWKSVVSNTYQGIMSGLDSAVGGAFLGATGYGVTAGLGAMANKASELKERGASNSQIALGAITSGLVEGLFEKVSLGYFFDKSDFSSIKAWIKTALIQGGIETSEELCTEIANIAAESIIQGYNSQNWQTINELVSNGMSLEKAQAQVSADNALGIFWAAYGGFISGGGMSITAGVPSYIANKIVDAKDNAQRIEALGEAVKKNNKGVNAVVRYATEHGLKADIDLKTATVKDVGKVADSVYQYAKKKMDVGDLNASEELYAELIEGTKASTVKGIINRAFQDVVIKQFNTDRETLAKAEKKALRKASGTVKTDTVDLKKPISDLVLSRKTDSTVTDADVEANRDVVSRIGKALGYEVIYDDGTVLGKANGKINFDNKTITLNTNVKNPVQWILKHEIGHFGQGTKAYADFISKVRKTQAYADWLRAKTGTNTSVDIMEAVLNRETRKLYEDAGYKLGGTTNILTGEKKGEITEANEEIISDFIADELFSGDTTNLENFLNELDKPTRNKFIQWILDLIDTIKQALTKGDKKIQAELSSLERQFADMLKESKTELQKADEKGTRTSISAENDAEYMSAVEKGEPIDIYSRIYEMQIEVNRLSREIQDIENSSDFKTKISEIFTSNDDTKTQIKKYQQLLDESDYGNLKKQRDALQVELEKLFKSYNEENTNKALKEEKDAIAKSGLSEADYFRKQAVKEFGYTPYFYDAGYITPNGKMLNFSGEKGQHYGSRGQDHRAIGIIYANSEGTDALNRFIKDGNIRIMPESPGIDISTVIEPTKEQYATIRKFVAEYANKGFFNVDLTDESGKVIGSLEYENNINPSRILNDIKHYYATGEIRQQSNIDRFRYSLSTDYTEGLSEANKTVAQTVIKNLKTSAISSKYLGGYATYTPERMERELSDSSSNGDLDYAKSYITWVNPIDFIYATTTNEKIREKLKEEAGTLDVERLRQETQPIHLTVNFETGEIVGHEGRHRMLALSEKGIDKVAVIIDALNDNRHQTKPIEFMPLKGQRFSEYLKGTDMYLHNMLPLSQRYADVARELFTNGPKSNIRFSVSLDDKFSTFKEVSSYHAEGKTLSDSALEAYQNGEMPKNVWSQKDFIFAVHEVNPKLNITDVNLSGLRELFLEKTDVHETGKQNTPTQFYKLNEEYVKNLTQKDIDSIVEAQDKGTDFERGLQYVNTEGESDYTEQINEVYRQFNEGKITEEQRDSKLDSLIADARKKYGTIEQGESVTGDEDYSHPVPERVSKETKNRRYVRTVTETGTLTKEMLRNEESAVLSGLRSFTPTSNKENLAKAMKRITNGQAEERWRAVVSGNASTHADDVALGELLLDGAIKSGDAVQALKLTAELSEVGTRLGQAVQALSLLKRMGGLGELYYVQKAVDSLNHNLDKQVGQKNHKQIKINEELALQLLETETEAELEYAMEAIMKDIASQVPATFLEKWNAWRYMAMLANPKTLIRNFVGNAVFAPSIMIKDSIATLGEMAFKPTERTKTFVVDKKYKDFAEADWERNKKLITHGGKYSPSNAIQDYRTIFKNPVLEGVRKKYGEWMETGDEVFIGGYYRRALSQYLAVNKVDIENIDETVLAKAQQHAMTEALKNTYRDASWLANTLNSIARNSMFGQMVVEGIIPFKKTPINILKRSVEYSPIGLIHTMGKGLINLKTQKYSGSQIIDSLAGGLTGTGIMLVGMICAKALIANFGFDDEDEWWRKLNGEQEFAIKIGDYSYTVDWMAPSVIPFFIGVSLMEQLMAENNEGAVDFVKIATSSVIEPLIQLSMLQGIQESITAFGTGADDTDKWGNFATSIISNYLTQPVPTIVGKVASTMDDTSRRNYIDKNSDIPTWLQSILKKTQAKIPWLSDNRTPYVNAWGEEEKTGSVWERLAENFVSPGYFSKATEDDITREVTRLYKSVGDKKVLPTTPKQYFDFKNYKKYLTEQEYYEMSVAVGKKNAELVAELLQHEDYEKLSDASKVAVINDIYNWSLACAKANLLYTFEEIEKMEIVDITEAQYNALKDTSKQAIAKEYFLNDTLWKQERKNGTVIDYLITKEIKESGKKPKDKASVDSIVKKFS